MKWIIGVILALVSQILINVGMQIQKIAHTKIRESQITQMYVKDPYWILGFAIQSLSGPCDFIAVGFASRSVLAPLVVVALIINMCLTPIMQHEKVSTKTIIITLCMALGIVVTVIFSPKVHHEYDTIQQQMDIYRSYYFLVFAIITGIIIVSLWTAAVKWKANLKIFWFTSSTLVGVSAALGWLLMKGVSASVMISTTHEGESCLVHWDWYLLLVFGILSLTSAFKWMNTALPRCSPIHVVPIANASNILLSIFGGLLVFEEYQDFRNVASKIMFTFGVIITLSSVLALSSTGNMIMMSGHQTRERSFSAGESIGKVASRRESIGVATNQNYQITTDKSNRTSAVRRVSLSSM